MTLHTTLRSIHQEVDKTYGKRRMKTELASKGYHFSLYKVAALMKEANVVALRPQKRHRYTDHEACHRVADNLLDRQFNPSVLNTHYVGDITYIKTHEGWTYLAAVMDLANREIVGWACSTKPNTSLALSALTHALRRHTPNTSTLLFHSDQGCQYTARPFVETLKNKGITQSMSRQGNCFDNAVMERFFRSLKTEKLRNISIVSHESATHIIDKYIRFYNNKRRHSANDNVAPAIKRQIMMNEA